MPYIDPRIVRASQQYRQRQVANAARAIMAQRAAQTRGRGVVVGPVGAQRAVVQQRQAQGNQRKSDQQANLREYQAQMQAQHPAQQQGGGGGFGWGSILHGAMTALTAPKNLVQTGVLELQEAITESDKTPHWARFLTVKPEQFKWFNPADQIRAGRSNADLILGHPGEWNGKATPGIGFGSMLQDLPSGPAIGPSWLRVHPGDIADKAIGFAGDVGMDPLTHLGPAEKAVSAGERLSLAQEAFEKGLSPEVIKAAGTGGSRAVRQLGENFAEDAAKLNLQQPGIYWGGREGIRIPGSGALGEIASAPSAKIRGALADTRLAELSRKWSVSAARDTELRNAVEAVVTGKGNKVVADPVLGAGMVNARNVARGAERRVLTDFEREIKATGRDVRGDTDAMTNWERQLAQDDPRIQKLRLMKELLTVRQLKEGVSLGDLNDEGLDYAMHAWLPDAMNDLNTVQHNVPLKGLDATKPEVQQFERAIKPGQTYNFKNTPLLGDVEFTPKVGDAKEINEFWTNAFGHKAIQDDPEKVLSMMTERAAAAVGRSRELQSLQDHGILRAEGRPGVDYAGREFGKSVPNKELKQANAAKKAVDQEQLMAGMAGERAGVEANQEALYGDINKGLQGRANQMVTDSQAAIDREKQNVADQLGQVKELTGQRGQLLKDSERASADAERNLARRQREYEASTAKVNKLADQLGTRENAARSTAWRKAVNEQRLAKSVLNDAEDMAAEVERQRSIYRQRIGRATDRMDTISGQLSDVAAQRRGAIGEAQANEDLSWLSAPEPTPEAPAMEPKDAARAAKWNEEIDHLEAQLAKKTGAKSARAEAQERLDYLREEVGLINQKYGVEPAAPAGPVDKLTSPLEEQIAGINTAAEGQLGRLARQGEVDQTQLGQQEAVKRQLDELYANRPTVEASAQEATAPARQAYEQAVAAQAGAETNVFHAQGNVNRFRNSVDNLSPDVRARLAELNPLIDDAEKGAAAAQQNLDGALKEMETAKGHVKTTKDLRNVPKRGDSWDDLHTQIKYVADHPDLFDERTKDLLAKAASGNADLAEHDENFEAAASYLKDIKSGKVDNVMKRVANDGMQLLKTDRLIGKDLVGSHEAVRAMTGLENTLANAKPGALGHAIDEYTKFFKAYATATPGFHIRNGMAATFMNLVAGTSFDEMKQGRDIWKAYRKDPLGNWYTKLPEGISKEQADKVVDAVLMSGAGGQFSTAELGDLAFGQGEERKTLRGRAWQQIKHNKAVEFSHNRGEQIEGIVRAGMAMHALSGENPSIFKAANLVKKYHFDYSDINELDNSVKRFIPFWTFMSRNLPLQVEQMYRNPKMYAEYQHLMDNVENPELAGQGLPSYLADMGARRVFGQWAFAPDIGPSQITNTAESLSHPQRLLANLNPPLKSALALATNRDFFYDEPYKANDYQKPGWELKPLIPILVRLGLAKNTAQGPVVQKKYLDAVHDQIPLLANVNRLGATSSDRQGKQAQSVATFFGVPLRKSDPAAMQRSADYNVNQGARDKAALQRALAKYNQAS